MKASRIVNVDVRAFDDLLKDGPLYRHRYAILRDKTAEEVLDFAKRHKKVFVFVFATKSIDECPDYSALDPVQHPDLYCSSDDLSHIVQPHYVGNFVEPENAIQEIVRFSLAEDFENAVLVTE
jgi:hypothetical protein